MPGLALLGPLSVVLVRPGLLLLLGVAGCHLRVSCGSLLSIRSCILPIGLQEDERKWSSQSHQQSDMQCMAIERVIHTIPNMKLLL